jgi:hypothetical protein
MTNGGFRRAVFSSVWMLLFCSAFELRAEILYVAVDGSDSSGDGSSSRPWATITHAIDSASDGDEIVVRPGTYNGRQRLRQQFASAVTVRSEIPYAAKLRYDRGAALVSFYGRNIVVEGFDIAHAPNNTAGLVIQVQDLLGEVNGSDGGTDPVVSGIVFRDNIIHSSTNNDLLKINNGAENIVVEGNLFFNQSGSDEHIDINSVIGVEVRDNVFFNTSARPNTSSFIVVKDSNGTDDTVLGTRDVVIRRNVFLNWHGNSGQSFVRLGEDGTSNFEARDVLVENNLMIGNSADLMRTPFTVQGSREVTFRNNTVAGDLPSRSFAARLIAGSSNPANRELVLTNNAWSDPTGSMGAEAYSGVDLFDAPPGETASAVLDTNLYFNGGNTIPPDATQFLTIADDANAVVADPMLPSSADAVVPLWDGSSFADGSSTIRQAFRRLVFAHGAPAPGSPLIDAGDPGTSAVDDILGQLRDARPDLGAFETGAGTGILFADGFESPSR